MATYRTLSLQHAEVSHFLVKYTEDQTFQVRTRGFIKSKGEIRTLDLHEVQWGKKTQVSTAVIIGAGTLASMKDLLQQKLQSATPSQSSQLSTTSSPRSPSPPPTTIPESRTPSPDIVPIQRRPRNTKTQKPKQKPLATVIGRGPPPPSDSEEEASPSILQPSTETPTIRQNPTIPRTLFSDHSDMLPYLDQILKSIRQINAKISTIDSRLKTVEAKQDLIITRQTNPTSTTPRIPTTEDTPDHTPDHTVDNHDPFDEVPAGMTIDEETRTKMRKQSHSAGNFAALIVKHLQPNLYGPDNLRQQYNWNGGGATEKRELCPDVKKTVKLYCNLHYPEMAPDHLFRLHVIPKVNESLRRPVVKRCRQKPTATQIVPPNAETSD